MPKGVSGRALVHRYARWFGVDLGCAVIELSSLGVEIDPGYLAALRASMATPRRRKETEPAQDDSSELAFIVGYTAGGVPYGIVREDGEDDDDVDAEVFVGRE